MCANCAIDVPKCCFKVRAIVHKPQAYVLHRSVYVEYNVLVPLRYKSPGA